MKNRVEKTTSMTAAMTCSIRAASFFEKDPRLKSEDFIAPLLLPRIMQPIVKSEIIRRVFMNKFAPQGIYEYVIARTKYLDEAVSRALREGVRQIVLLGAGYDSRAARFHSLDRGAVFFELDSPFTQEAKKAQYQKRNIAVPPQCRFIPVNFNAEAPDDRLVACGYQTGARSLFILEGVLMYLTEEAVSAAFRMMENVMCRGSRAVCDFIYRSVLRKENIFYGEESIYKRVNKYGEAWKSGIERNEIIAYFSGKGFSVSEIADADFLKRKYFNDDGRYKINGTHCLVSLER